MKKRPAGAGRFFVAIGVRCGETCGNRHCPNTSPSRCARHLPSRGGLRRCSIQGLPLRGAGSRRLTERCCRSTLWGGLRESPLPQHLSVIGLSRCHLPSRGGLRRCNIQGLPLRGAGSRRLTERCDRSAFSENLTEIATALTPLRHRLTPMPPPLKGRHSGGHLGRPYSDHQRLTTFVSAKPIRW